MYCRRRGLNFTFLNTKKIELIFNLILIKDFCICNQNKYCQIFSILKQTNICRCIHCFHLEICNKLKPRNLDRFQTQYTSIDRAIYQFSSTTKGVN